MDKKNSISSYKPHNTELNKYYYQNNSINDKNFNEVNVVT